MSIFISSSSFIQEGMNTELDNLLERQSTLENKMGGLHKIL